MKTSKKVAILVAVLLVVIGGGLCVASLAMNQFDMRKMSNMTWETKAYEIQEGFANIRVEDVSNEVRVEPSEDGRCRVVCCDSNRLLHTVGVVGDTLRVSYQDNRLWYEWFGIFWMPSPAVTVYLPPAQYAQLYVRTVSGGIRVTSPMAFEQVQLYSTSGGIAFAGTAQELSAESTSGGIALSGLRGGMVTAKTTSGGIALSDATMASLSAGTVSGGLQLKDVRADGAAALQTVSGSIRFDRFDAQSITAKTTSGSVTGTLLSAKDFSTHTTSGGVRVPPSDTGAGRCDITTTSGSIRIDLA